ncbi:MAG: DNA-directed RNA polymerase subunit omega [Firmicutes bacterium]|nr:DNA-directed RNA polymerase subunit omega [Bacillota bacterium]MBR7113389.1 DNA-directed RNA polymerase subunit omega [Bacillota bacterium]
MLNSPSINELMQQADSKYTLVIVAAKRARAAITANPALAATPGVNPVSEALKEIAAGELSWHKAEAPVVEEDAAEEVAAEIEAAEEVEEDACDE